MGSDNPIDRREYSRVSLDMEIEVCPLSSDDSKVDFVITICRARDVSGGGVSFYAATRFENDSVLRLRIPLGGSQASHGKMDKKLLKVMGKVMWSRKNSSESNFVTGVQFLNIYEQDFQILSEYVERNSELS